MQTALIISTACAALSTGALTIAVGIAMKALKGCCEALNDSAGDQRTLSSLSYLLATKLQELNGHEERVQDLLATNNRYLEQKRYAFQEMKTARAERNEADQAVRFLFDELQKSGYRYAVEQSMRNRIEASLGRVPNIVVKDAA